MANPKLRKFDMINSIKLVRDKVFSGETMCLSEKQYVFWRDNVFSGETMCLPQRECAFRGDNVSAGETMCLPERQCVFRRDNVSSRETMCRPERQCVCPRHTSRMFPAHKLGSRWSPDMFPVPNRIKMMRAIQ